MNGFAFQILKFVWPHNLVLPTNNYSQGFPEFNQGLC